MNVYSKLYVKVSSIVPKGIVKKYEQYVITADLRIDARTYIGFTLLLSILSGFVSIMFFLNICAPLLYALPLGVITGAIIMAFFYVRIALLSDARAAQIENYLPEALQLIAANIRAGMTVDKALWLCARPEFGPFEKELRKMAAETLGGKPITTALTESAKRVKSVILDRAYLLLIQGIELGGALANLLTEIASDIRTNQALRSEITAATTMYTIFIIFASVLAAPMLFAVSSFYVQATNKIWQSQQSGGPSGGGYAGLEQQGDTSVLKMSQENSLTFEEVRIFAVACIIITTFFGSLSIGMIKYGAARKGIRYIPIFVSAALAIYFIGYLIVSSAFADILR